MESKPQAWEDTDFRAKYYVFGLAYPIPKNQRGNSPDKQIEVHLRKGVTRITKIACLLLNYGFFCKVAIKFSKDPPSSSVSLNHSCNSLAEILSLAQA